MASSSGNAVSGSGGAADGAAVAHGYRRHTPMHCCASDIWGKGRSWMCFRQNTVLSIGNILCHVTIPARFPALPLKSSSTTMQQLSHQALLSSSAFLCFFFFFSDTACTASPLGRAAAARFRCRSAPGVPLPPPAAAAFPPAGLGALPAASAAGFAADFAADLAAGLAAGVPTMAAAVGFAAGAASPLRSNSAMKKPSVPSASASTRTKRSAPLNSGWPRRFHVGNGSYSTMHRSGAVGPDASETSYICSRDATLEPHPSFTNQHPCRIAVYLLIHYVATLKQALAGVQLGLCSSLYKDLSAAPHLEPEAQLLGGRQHRGHDGLVLALVHGAGGVDQAPQARKAQRMAQRLLLKSCKPLQPLALPLLQS